MASLKGLLFTQYAGEGLGQLVEEMQNKFKPKKGRRFHHNNITYEVSRPTLKENKLEFEISSKIPQDELKNPKGMSAYFKGIKDSISSKKSNLVSIEMENIVWDSKKDTEKERDYVKVLYSYALDDLYDNKKVIEKYEAISKGSAKEKLPEVPGVFTDQGKLVLIAVRDTIQEIGRENIRILIDANKKVKDKLKK